LLRYILSNFALMFRSLANLSLIILLLLSTCGMSITKHYCGKTLVQTAIYSTPDKCCDSNCPGCHDKRVHIQIKDRFEASNAQFDFSALVKIINEHHYLPFLTFQGINSLVVLTLEQRAKRNPHSKFSNIQLAGKRISFLQTFLI